MGAVRDHRRTIRRQQALLACCRPFYDDGRHRGARFPCGVPGSFREAAAAGRCLCSLRATLFRTRSDITLRAAWRQPKKRRPEARWHSGLQSLACSVTPVEATGLAFDDPNLAWAPQAGQGVNAAPGRRPSPTPPEVGGRNTDARDPRAVGPSRRGFCPRASTKS